MQEERGANEFAITNLVGNDAADNDAEAETGQARAADLAELRAGEAVFGAPVSKDTAANGEADAGGKNGHETGPKEPLAMDIAGGHRDRCSW